MVENITVMNPSSDKISTVDLNGPVCISYISDKQTVPQHMPSLKRQFPFLSYPSSPLLSR